MTKEILGYKIKKYNEDSIIPNNAIFLQMVKKSVFFSIKYHYYNIYIYQVPIYKEKTKQ